MGKVWLIASGKGGVGKSFLAAGLGGSLARLKQKVCIVDADIGLRDQDAILGVSDRVVYDLMDVIRRDCTLDQALIKRQDGLALLPAAQFSRVKEVEPKAFARVIGRLKLLYDHVIIDCPAGIERGLRGLLKSHLDEAIIVCTPDDVCIRDAERACSLLRDKELSPRIIVNRVIPELVRAGEMYNAQTVAQTLDAPLLGELPEDRMVCRALLAHIPVSEVACEASAAMMRIARRMNGEEVPQAMLGSERPGFFHRLFSRRLKEVIRI